MTRIVVLGATGYAGRYVVDEAASRGHTVVAASRQATASDWPEGVEARNVDVADPEALASAIADADVIVSALSPRSSLGEGFLDAFRALGDAARDQGVRLIAVGGFSSLRSIEGADRYIDAGEFPPLPDGAPALPEPTESDAWLVEPRQMVDALLQLTERDDDLDWTFVSPGLLFGAHVPGERTGRYRTGGDVALFDENGFSAVSGADFAIALVDEVEQSAHRGEHMGIAY